MRVRLTVLVLGVGLVIGAGGCRRSLFPPREPRTQFDSYDALRGRYIPVERPDVFGNPQPALRARLTKQ